MTSVVGALLNKLVAEARISLNFCSRDCTSFRHIEKSRLVFNIVLKRRSVGTPPTADQHVAERGSKMQFPKPSTLNKIPPNPTP